MITIQNADAALKDYYLDAISAQLNDNVSPFFSAIEKNSDSVSGKDVKLSIVRENCGNIKAGAEDGDLPAPYKNRYVNISVPLKNLYGTIEISDKAMRASRESAGAFVNLVNAEMEGLVSSAKQNLRRMLFCDGSALLCSIENVVSNREFTVDVAKNYFVGMQVDFCTSKKVPVPSGIGVYITAVDAFNKKITVSADITDDVVNGYIYVHGSKDNELTGLDAIFSRYVLYGVNKKEDDFFYPHIVDSAGPVQEKVLFDILDYMEENFNSKINMMLCSYKTRRKIAEFIDENRRVVNTIDVHTGYGEVTVNGVPVYAEKYCPDDRIYFVNTDDFALYQLCDWEWLEDEDGKILKQVPGKAAYSATLVKYAELICRKPCCQAMLIGIED